ICRRRLVPPPLAHRQLVLSPTRPAPPCPPQATAAISSSAGAPPLASPQLGRRWLVHQAAGSPSSPIDSRRFPVAATSIFDRLR
ncbi:Os09g0539901, partial [Oryza sativa Japonica Group]